MPIVRARLALCIALCCSSCGDVTSTSDANTSEALRESFPADEVIPIALTLDDADWQTIRAEGEALTRTFADCGDSTFGYTTVDAELRIEGRDFGAVRLAKRGDRGTLSMFQPSLHVDLATSKRDRHFRGLQALYLENTSQDPSVTRQCPAYATFRAAGVPAPRCALARVEVNGQDLGYYTLIEPIEESFLRRVFRSASGHLYEGTLDADFRAERLSLFEDRSLRPSKPSDVLRRVSDVLAAPTDAAFERRLAALVDIRAFLRFWAVETLIADWGGYTGDLNNFYVYVRPDTGKLEFIPWGTTHTYEYRHGFLPEVGRPQSVFAAARLARRLYELPETRERYRTELRTLLNEVWDEDMQLSEVERIAALVQAPDGYPLQTQRALIGARRAELQAELDAEAPAWPFQESPVRECRDEAISALSATFTIPWGDLGAIQPSPSNTLDVWLDGERRTFAQMLGGAGLSRPEQGARPSLLLLAPQPTGRSVVLQLYLGPQPLAAGARPFHGFEVYGALVLALDRERFELKGFVGDGTITLEHAGTDAGSVLRGRVDAHLVTLTPEEAANGSRL